MAGINQAGASSSPLSRDSRFSEAIVPINTDFSLPLGAFFGVALPLAVLSILVGDRAIEFSSNLAGELFLGDPFANAAGLPALLNAPSIKRNNFA